MELKDALEKIRSMEVRGAGRIARFAAGTIKEHVEGTAAGTPEELDNELRDVLKDLHETRPTAVSLRNALRFIYRSSFSEQGDRIRDLTELKASIIKACDDFSVSSERATAMIGKLGADLVKDGFRIQTHCNSHNAIAVIKTAFEQGKRLSVYASESRPWFQGRLTVRELAESGIPVTLIVDSAVRHFMDRIDLVLVGADTITAGGDLINKIGTAQVALAAKDAGVPFYVCAETIKFSPESLYEPDKVIEIEERDPSEVIDDPEAFGNVNIANPVFDITPSKNITGIITEKGILGTDGVEDFIKKNYGENDRLDFLF